MATETTTEEDVYEALEEVIDPELGLDFVSLGLVYDVELEGPEAFITFTLTTPACPIGPQVSEQMREFVGQLQGIEKVHPKMVFDPPWSPEMMSDLAGRRARARRVGGCEDRVGTERGAWRKVHRGAGEARLR